MMGRIILGNDQQAGSVLVQSVDDAGPQRAADAGEAAAAVGQQGVDQGSRFRAGGGVDDEALGLVDDDQVGILEDNI